MDANENEQPEPLGIKENALNGLRNAVLEYFAPRFQDLFRERGFPDPTERIRLKVTEDGHLSCRYTNADGAEVSEIL